MIKGTTQAAALATRTLAQRRSIQISSTALADKGAGDIARDAAQNLKEGAQNYAQRAKEGAYNAAETVKEKAHDLKEKIVGSDTADHLRDAKESARQAKDNAKESLRETKDNVKGAARDKANDAKDAAKRYTHNLGEKDPNERIQR